MNGRNPFQGSKGVPSMNMSVEGNVLHLSQSLSGFEGCSFVAARARREKNIFCRNPFQGSKGVPSEQSEDSLLDYIMSQSLSGFEGCSFKKMVVVALLIVSLSQSLSGFEGCSFNGR